MTLSASFRLAFVPYNVGAVQKTLDAVSPAVEQAKKKYIEAHDIVVVSNTFSMPATCHVLST